MMKYTLKNDLSRYSLASCVLSKFLMSKQRLRLTTHVEVILSRSSSWLCILDHNCCLLGYVCLSATLGYVVFKGVLSSPQSSQLFRLGYVASQLCRLGDA
jgi:hypothetical protein